MKQGLNLYKNKFEQGGLTMRHFTRTSTNYSNLKSNSMKQRVALLINSAS